MLIACVGGGSNSIGLFHPFLADSSVKMIGAKQVVPATSWASMRRDSTEAAVAVPVLQGTMSYVLQDQHGQVASTHPISAGLDYPSIGPEHAFLHDSERVNTVR